GHCAGITIEHIAVVALLSDLDDAITAEGVSVANEVQRNRAVETHPIAAVLRTAKQGRPIGRQDYGEPGPYPFEDKRALRRSREVGDGVQLPGCVLHE